MADANDHGSADSKSDDEDNHQATVSDLWKKMEIMRRMRERFKKLEEEERQEDSEMPQEEKVEALALVAAHAESRAISSESAAITTSPFASGRKLTGDTAQNRASLRWTKIRRVVLSDKLNHLRGDRSGSATPQISPRVAEESAADRQNSAKAALAELEDDDEEASPEVRHSRAMEVLRLEDIDLAAAWAYEAIPPSFALDESSLPVDPIPPEHEAVDGEFDQEVRPAALDVSKIPEDVVTQRQTTVESLALAQHKQSLHALRKAQTDAIFREDLARTRVRELERQARLRLRQEKAKVLLLARAKQAELGRAFKVAREGLEEGLRRQEGAVKESFGHLTPHRESMARRFEMFTTAYPQPLELRVHMLRGVKNKLAKGAYALMLTMFDSLGGHPLTWGGLAPCGIDDKRPGITRVLKHQGRYFDRSLKVEDSVFALCPPQQAIRPGMVLILELFQLQSHRCHCDRIVGWAAIPLALESQMLVEGKLRVPMLRGEHGPHYSHYKDIEATMANNLDHWLCNVYLEARPLSLRELGADERMLKAVDYQLDYLNLNIGMLDNTADTNDNDKKMAGKDGMKSKPSSVRSMVSSPAMSPTAHSPSLFHPHGTPAHQQTLKRGHGNARLTAMIDRDMSSASMISSHSNTSATINNSYYNNTGLAVDKGLFRRRLPAHHPLAMTTDNDADEADDQKQDEEKKLDALEAGEKKKDDDKKQQPSSRSLFARWMSFKPPTVAPEHSPKHNKLPQLQNGESFAAHRAALVKRWKMNVKQKQLLLSSSSLNNHETEVLERGYDLGYGPAAKEFLHPEQRGKLSGVEAIDNYESRSWAAAGLEGTVVRRWQSEGLRLDSEAATGNPLSPKNDKKVAFSFSSPNLLAEEFDEEGQLMKPDHVPWEELRDGRELSAYSMSVAYDPTRHRHLMPGAVSRSKIRYLTLELFGDLFPSSAGSIEFYLTIALYLFALWMRGYAHYVAQYLFLLSTTTPIFAFELQVLQIQFKYGSTSLSDSSEVGIVAAGPLGCIVLMAIFSMLGLMFYRFSGFLPDACSKLFAYFGLAVVIDPFLVFLVDMAYHNYDCGDLSDACALSYTSRDCNCFHGDFIKLYLRSIRTEGSGLTGIFITCLIYLGCATLAAFVLYEYLLNVHRDGRILDLWRRLNGPAEEFFVPEDLEVSTAELHAVLSKAKRWHGAAGARRKVTIHERKDKDPNSANFDSISRHYIIEEVEKDGSAAIHRQFVLDGASGRITEVFEDKTIESGRKKAFAAFHSTNVDDDPDGDHNDNRSRNSSRRRREHEHTYDYGDDDRHSDSEGEDDGGSEDDENHDVGDHNNKAAGANKNNNASSNIDDDRRSSPVSDLLRRRSSSQSGERRLSVRFDDPAVVPDAEHSPSIGPTPKGLYERGPGPSPMVPAQTGSTRFEG